MIIENFTKISDELLLDLCQKFGKAALTWKWKFIGLLPEVNRRKLYESHDRRKKSYSSVVEFAQKLAGISREQVYNVLSLDRVFEDKPILRKMLVNGQVSINKLIRITSVVTEENQEFWATQVKFLSKSAIETLVRDEKILRAKAAENGGLFGEMGDEIADEKAEGGGSGEGVASVGGAGDVESVGGAGNAGSVVSAGGVGCAGNAGGAGSSVGSVASGGCAGSAGGVGCARNAGGTDETENFAQNPETKNCTHDGLQEPKNGYESLPGQRSAQSDEQLSGQQSGLQVAQLAGQPPEQIAKHKQGSIPEHQTFAHPLKLLKLQLGEQLVGRLLEMQHKGLNINEILIAALQKRDEEIAVEKEKLHEIAVQEAKNLAAGSDKAATAAGAAVLMDATTNQIADKKAATQNPIPKKPSRPIKVTIKNLLNQENGTKCAIPTCEKLSKPIHHSQRFAIAQIHDPYFMAPLCADHHQIAHAIDLQVQKKRSSG